MTGVPEDGAKKMTGLDGIIDDEDARHLLLLSS